MNRKILLYFTAVFLLIQFGAAQPASDIPLREFVEQRFSRDNAGGRKFRFDEFCQVHSNTVAARVFREYGSIFAADGSVNVPRTCIFSTEKEVSKFQDSVDTESARIGGFEIELQEAAMDALLDAIDEAEDRGLRITPLDGVIAGKRSFADTVRLWNSRFVPALNHWVALGRIKKEDADAALKMSVLEQTTKVFDWESRGLYFSTGKNRPIMASVAPPGTSQHLSMLAFDIEQAGNRTARAILNRHGWFQTIIGDSPHFTYLGASELKLPERGLKLVVSGGFRYWVPRVAATPVNRPSPGREN